MKNSTLKKLSVWSPNTVSHNFFIFSCKKYLENISHYKTTWRKMGWLIMKRQIVFRSGRSWMTLYARMKSDLGNIKKHSMILSTWKMIWKWKSFGMATKLSFLPSAGLTTATSQYFLSYLAPSNTLFVQNALSRQNSSDCSGSSFIKISHFCFGFTSGCRIRYWVCCILPIPFEVVERHTSNASSKYAGTITSSYASHWRDTTFICKWLTALQT